MGPFDFIAIGVILLIAGGAIFYIVKAKKSGKKCIGCPDADTFGSNRSGGCSGNCGSCGGSCHCDESDTNDKKDQ